MTTRVGRRSRRGVRVIITRLGSSVNVGLAVEVFENPVEGFESEVVPTAVDVLGVDVDDFPTKLVGYVPGDAGLARPGRPVEDRSLAGLSMCDGVERGRGFADFLAAGHDGSDDEFGQEHACIANYVLPVGIQSQ